MSLWWLAGVIVDSRWNFLQFMLTDGPLSLHFVGITSSFVDRSDLHLLPKVLLLHPLLHNRVLRRCRFDAITIVRNPGIIVWGQNV